MNQRTEVAVAFLAAEIMRDGIPDVRHESPLRAMDAETADRKIRKAFLFADLVLGAEWADATADTNGTKVQ